MSLRERIRSGALLLVIPLTAFGHSESARSADYQVLYNFVGGLHDGAHPISTLLLRKGNLYGTTEYGGDSGLLGPGVVFRVALDGSETVLHIFNYSDGNGPQAGLTTDPITGKLYGSTTDGGAYGGGVLFRLEDDGAETVLHHFNPASDGNFPRGRLIHDSQGNFYGIASSLGGQNHGTIYRLAQDGSFKVLHTFVGSDGEDPAARLERDRAGNLYGTTFFGGANNSGTVFKLLPSGTLVTLHSFSGSDGARPIGRLLRDKAGNLYGTTLLGGAANQGVLFKLASDGTETVLHDFSGGADGAQPQADLMRIGGTLYGTTGSGGDSCDCGTVFKFTLDGRKTILHSFNGSDGANPYAGLIKGKNGVLYGTTANGGSAGDGVVFRVSSN
ncbi:MAG TPA: choice-of-anchor tandem repeat GloVer-containing protein [Rhizomicrobium sp.]|nr:choice-of-anchor tandem repeat GloVer-containing protein [Rhizomicrobium sp.]